MDELEQDQADLVALLEGDDTFANVAVLPEYKGDIESDIDQTLATLNEKTGKIGACAVVLQPVERPTEEDTPSPQLKVRLSVQCFDQPLFNDDETTGTGETVWSIARRVRQLMHYRSFGRGAYYWVGTEDVPQADPGRRSRIVTFERLANEHSVTRVSPPIISPAAGGVVPQSVTITSVPGAAIYYTLDGTFPTAITGTLYAGAFDIEAAATLRAVAYLSGALPSALAQANFTAA